MRWLALAVLALVVLALALASCGAAPERTPPPTVTLQPAPTATDANAWPAPDFTLTSLEGDAVALGDLRGQWIVVNFWATWCAPCVEEMPALQAVAERYAGDLVVLGVNLREPPDDLRAFVAEHAITYPILLEPDDAILLDYQVTALPQTLIVDPDGLIVWRQFGPLALDTFDALIASLMAA